MLSNGQVFAQNNEQALDTSAPEFQPGHFGDDLYYELGLNFGLVVGKVDLENSTARPHIGPAITVGYRKGAWAAEIAWLNTGIQYESYVPRSDTIQPVYFSVLDTTFDLPTYFTADVEGEYNMNYLEGRISYRLMEKERSRLELALRVSYLITGSNRGTALVDIGTFAGRQDEFDSEAEYLNSLYSRLPEEFDDSAAMSKFDFGLMLKYRFLLYNNMKMFTNLGGGFRPVQEKTDLVLDSYYNLFFQLGLTF